MIKEVKLILKRFWLLIIFMVVGFYDFFENGSVNSLIGASLIFVFLIVLNQFKKLSPGILGVFILIISIWGIIDNLIVRDEIIVGKMILSFGFFALGLVLVLNKFDLVIEAIKTNKIIQIIFVTGLLAYLYIFILEQQNMGVIEILILTVALIFGITILLPEKKKN